MTSRRNPFDELERALERMGEQFDGGFGGMAQGIGSSVAVDVADHDDEYVVSADLPGYDREDIDVEVTDDTLTISAEREEEREEQSEDETYVRHERSHQSAHRSVRIPGPIEETEASATYKNGVLTVTLPKRGDDSGGRTIDVE